MAPPLEGDELKAAQEEFNRLYPVDNSPPPLGALVRDGLKFVGWGFRSVGSVFDAVAKQVERDWNSTNKRP